MAIVDNKWYFPNNLNSGLTFFTRTNTFFFISHNLTSTSRVSCGIFGSRTLRKCNYLQRIAETIANNLFLKLISDYAEEQRMFSSAFYCIINMFLISFITFFITWWNNDHYLTRPILTIRYQIVILIFSSKGKSNWAVISHLAAC